MGISLFMQAPGAQGCRAGWVYGGWVLDGERSGTVGQEKRMVNGGERSGLQGWEEGPVPKIGTGRVLVLTTLPGSVLESYIVMCWGEWVVHRDAPKATDFFLEAVKVIDLSQDRLKGTKRFS